MNRSVLKLSLAAAALIIAVGCGKAPPPPPPPPDNCTAGTNGCACSEGDRCGLTAGGEQLICQGGVCENAHCSAGGSGCVCKNGTDCADPADSCQSGFCVKSGCAPGSENCGCLAGSCDLGLRCMENTVCISNKGYEGGECLDNDQCYRGARCDLQTARCVYCDVGTSDCQCTTAKGCNAGLVCANGLCLSQQKLPPPNPECFTPCRSDLVTDGGTVACTTDQLIPGCLQGQSCTAGSCLNPGETKPTCQNDLDCPFYQVCLAGGCYSNCEVNADCPSAQGCSAHACRQSCIIGNNTACPVGYACTADDGQSGYCTPVGRSAPSQPSALPTGGIALPVDRLELSNVNQSGELIVMPQTNATQDVTVRKLWHQIFYSDGTTERVDAPLDSKGEYRACDPAKNECPLWWLQMAAPGAPEAQTPTIGFRLIPGCVDDLNFTADAGTAQGDGGARVGCPRLKVTHAGGVQAVRWQGALQISTKDAHTEVTLEYVERPEGQWTGSMYYFGTFNRTGVDTWINRTDKTDMSGVENGLLQRWGALRLGSLEGWQEFLAVLTSTRNESWKFGTVADHCKQATGNSLTAACYPYSNTAGVRVYVQNTNAAPIPSGVSELPVALNLRIKQGSPTVFEGRVESAMAMHYPGNPAISLEFAGDPSSQGSCFTGGGTDCLVFLKPQSSGSTNNQLISTVGGRYVTTTGTCAPGYTAVHIPWLVPGFTLGTSLTSQGSREVVECRDNALPFDTTDSKFIAVNQSLAGGNPVPDGNPRKRTLRFIDGALVNQSELFVLFEESYQSSIPGQPDTTAYGYMRLKRAAADLNEQSYTGTPASSATHTPPIAQGATCDPSLLAGIPNASNLPNLVNVLLNGTNVSAGYASITASTPGKPDGIYYYCEDTGLFNGGAGDLTQAATACPVGSKVIYFYAPTKTPVQVAAEPCQTTQVDGRATCFNTYSTWKNNGVVQEENPVFTCDPVNNVTPVFCDDDRLNLRAAKTFYRRLPNVTTRNFLKLRQVVDNAFRYKTRFRSSSGGTLGFAPVQCIPNSDQVPYCYDPAQIEEARQRIDCLVSIYSDPNQLNQLDAATKNSLLTFLGQSFSTFGGGYDGFERLNAELLIMQGDEALTSAYASRFDLAAAGGASFKGSAFEPNGIDLTGVAGAEMFELYQAVQYYQLALDRLYLLGPNMSIALSRGAVGTATNFITPEMVTSYLERLVRAASQKSRAWGEIGRRYQNFNRPDLARRAIERAYVATYLESALISDLMLGIAKNSSQASQAQIRLTIEKAQLTYRMALLDMREMYQQISDQMNIFGFPPDYIPFPALDNVSATSTNAYDTLASVARTRLDLARTREQVALSSAKQGRVDAVQFQADLTSIRNNYENQLASVCGTFTGDDGNIYPAIKKYAYQSSVATLMGDPCGRMGNGDLHNAMGAVKDSSLKLQGTVLRHENLLKEIDIERARVAKQCELVQSLADYQYDQSGTTYDMQLEMDKQRAQTAFITGSIGAAANAIGVLDCEIQCASSAAMAATVLALGVASAGTQYATENKIAEKERDLKDFERDSVKKTTESQCTSLDGGQGVQTIDSDAKIANLYNETLEAQLESLRAEYSLRLSLSEVQRLFSSAQRIQAQQQEAEQLSIDIQAAQNDPNVRIYQNDAVINADVSFNDALAMAYRLTRVYEYYTSTSYAKKGQLFLIRMISAGQYNLENYLLELDNAFQSFEEQFGQPDTRVIALSLRDDILQIPYLSESNTPLSESDRINMMRGKLKDVRLLNEKGYLTLPFSTNLKALSPLTRNHKIQHVEIDLQGVKMGDSVARVYLRMSGTGLIRNVQDDIDYYVFPERVAVVNASLLGSKVYDPEVYRSFRFRDRPLVNTLWELILNQRDEVANQDIDLQTLTDIRVLIYYSDFTQL